MRIQTPPGCTAVSDGPNAYAIDPETGTIEVPEDVAPRFLRLEGFKEVPTPAVTPTRNSNRKAAETPAPSSQED